MEYWNDGELEHSSDGVLEYGVSPIIQYSSIPLFPPIHSRHPPMPTEQRSVRQVEELV
jgi:hypothetical protein